MDDYIKREQALKLIESGGIWGWSKNALYGEMKDLPAADVAPVVHAFWNSDEKCSACGEKSTEGLDAEKWNYWLPPFCPHCGAKMDLEEDKQ